MAYFDRHDILAAWNLYLQHSWTGQGCPNYKRHTRLNMLGWLPSPAEQRIQGLSENALDIYLDLLGDETPKAEHPIANPSDASDDKSLFEFQFGAYGDDHVYVWADDIEDALEEAFEWLDENAPGHLVPHLRMQELYREAADELGLRHDTQDEDERDRIMTRAEVDLTICGHTTLENGAALNSSEWYVDEITDGDDVYLASRAQVRAEE